MPVKISLNYFGHTYTIYWLEAYDFYSMQAVTIYRHNDGTARMLEWTVPDIKWAEIMTFTQLPSELVEKLLKCSREKANSILDEYVPKL